PEQQHRRQDLAVGAERAGDAEVLRLQKARIDQEQHQAERLAQELPGDVDDGVEEEAATSHYCGLSSNARTCGGASPRAGSGGLGRVRWGSSVAARASLIPKPRPASVSAYPRVCRSPKPSVNSTSRPSTVMERNVPFWPKGRSFGSIDKNQRTRARSSSSV